MLADSGCDIAVIFDYPGMRRPRRRSWLRVRLTRDRVLVALPATHRLAAQPTVRLDELADERWVVSEHGRTEFLDACQVAGILPSVGLTDDDYHAIPNLVAAGFGVALVSDLIIGAVPGESVAVRPLTAAPDRDVAAIVERTSARTPTVKAALEALKTAAARFATDPGRPATD